ncbi:MAG: Flp pilus assembly complex ATPase component TadA, partial [Candidatus Andersenbacteria bacterium]|nr:Flp pilus assembly complex ATPase component TadA [Candidatus Andersenbacteria bacterium]
MPDTQDTNSVIDSTQHFLASREQLVKDEQLSKKLDALRLQGQARESEAIGMALGLPYIDLTAFPINKEILALIPEQDARAAGAVAFFLQDGNLRLATVDPLNGQLVELIERLVNEQYSVKLYVTSQASFDRVMKVYRQILVAMDTSSDDVLDLGAFDSTKAVAALQELSSLGGRLVAVSPSELVTTVLRAAASAGASDLHLEATPTDAVLRFRLDGVLQDVAQLPSATYDALVTRLKLLANVKVNVRDEPQDGRFSLKAGEDSIDLRFSSLPTAFGESIVIRFLGLGPELSLDQLGLREEALATLKDAISASLGLVLTTGPTGSGKTTALYAALRDRMSPDVKIITLENPVEVKVPGLQQVNIAEEDGLTFATALRSVLRQDPDIVLVGEIRDAET